MESGHPTEQGISGVAVRAAVLARRHHNRGVLIAGGQSAAAALGGGSPGGGGTAEGSSGHGFGTGRQGRGAEPGGAADGLGRRLWWERRPGTPKDINQRRLHAAAPQSSGRGLGPPGGAWGRPPGGEGPQLSRRCEGGGVPRGIRSGAKG